MQNQKEKQFEAFDSFEQFFDQAEERSDYWAERAKLEFTREVLSKMEQAGVSKSELASRLGVQPGMVTRLLSGKNNFELLTMVRLALALKCRYRSHLHPLEVSTMWIDVLSEEPKRENVIRWNPMDFKTVESSGAVCDELNYVPIAINSR